MSLIVGDDMQLFLLHNLNLILPVNKNMFYNKYLSRLEILLN